MRTSFLFLIILVSIFSCGRKKHQVLQYGSITLDGGTTLRNEIYLDHDSVFEEFRDTTGRLCILRKAVSEKALRDSTYSTVYFYDNGNVMETKALSAKIPVGKWMDYYPDGKKKSESDYVDGKLSKLILWWQNGNVNVETDYPGNGKIIHREFYENGNPAQQLDVDSLFSGKCVNFYETGKIKGEGNVFHKNPSGLWKMYDSLGNSRHDTLFIAEGPLKMK